MRYKLLGRSGLRVSELCLGALTFGQEWGIGVDKEESGRVLGDYLEAGGNFIDTANRYNDGTSETIVGELLAGRRQATVLATKYSLSMDHADPNAGGNHRKNMMQSVEASLKRLRTDYIDLYWLHNWDYMTPVEEVMRAFDDLVRSGKVLYIGISNAPAWIVSQANTLAACFGWSKFVAIQVEYSLIERTVEREQLPMARALDLAVCPWSPLGGGVLTGKYSGQAEQDAKASGRGAVLNQPRITAANLAIAQAVARVAQEVGQTSAQVALSWVRQQPGVMVPIIGARTQEQLRQNLGCLDFTLTEGQLDFLAKASAIDLGYPYVFQNRERIITQLYGDKAHQIDNHRGILRPTQE